MTSLKKIIVSICLLSLFVIIPFSSVSGALNVFLRSDWNYVSANDWYITSNLEPPSFNWSARITNASLNNGSNFSFINWNQKDHWGIVHPRNIIMFDTSKVFVYDVKNLSGYKGVSQWSINKAKDGDYYMITVDYQTLNQYEWSASEVVFGSKESYFWQHGYKVSSNTTIYGNILTGCRNSNDPRLLNQECTNAYATQVWMPRR